MNTSIKKTLRETKQVDKYKQIAKNIVDKDKI